MKKTYFISASGTTYHLNKECTYLKFSKEVKEYTYDELKALEKETGKKFKPCSRCAKNKKESK